MRSITKLVGFCVVLLLFFDLYLFEIVHEEYTDVYEEYYRFYYNDFALNGYECMSDSTISKLVKVESDNRHLRGNVNALKITNYLIISLFFIVIGLAVFREPIKRNGVV